MKDTDFTEDGHYISPDDKIDEIKFRIVELINYGVSSEKIILFEDSEEWEGWAKKILKIYDLL